MPTYGSGTYGSGTYGGAETAGPIIDLYEVVLVEMHYGAPIRSVPPGLESVVCWNGLRLNERRLADRWFLSSIDGLMDADIRDSREVNPGEHGETAFESLYGGRTVVLEGRAEAGNMAKMRELQEQLKRVSAPLVEMPMVFERNGMHESFTTPGSIHLYRAMVNNELVPLADVCYLGQEFVIGEGFGPAPFVFPPSLGIKTKAGQNIQCIVPQREVVLMDGAVLTRFRANINTANEQRFGGILRMSETTLERVEAYVERDVTGGAVFTVKRFDSSGAVTNTWVSPSNTFGFRWQGGDSDSLWFVAFTQGTRVTCRLMILDPAIEPFTPSIGAEFTVPDVTDMLAEGLYRGGMWYPGGSSETQVFEARVDPLDQNEDVMLFVKKSSSLQGNEQQRDMKYKREFQFTGRASHPSFETTMEREFILDSSQLTAWDTYSTNTIPNYTFEAGSGTLSVSGGQLVPSSTAEKRAYMSTTPDGLAFDPNDRVMGGFVSLKVIRAASQYGDAGVILKLKGTTRHILFRHNQTTASDGVLEIRFWDGAAYTTKATVDWDVASGATLWVRGGYYLDPATGDLKFTIEGHSTEPVDPYKSGTIVSTTYTAVGGDASYLGGPYIPGLRIVPPTTTMRYDDLKFDFVRIQDYPVPMYNYGNIASDIRATFTNARHGLSGAAEPEQQSFFVLTDGVPDYGQEMKQLELSWDDVGDAAVGAPINEIQQFVIQATGGTYTISFDGQTTGAINHNASISTIITALEALSNIAPGDVVNYSSSDDVPNNKYTRAIQFAGVYAGVNVSQITINDGSLTVYETNTIKNIKIYEEIQGDITGGTFVLRFADHPLPAQDTSPISVFATVAEVDTALEALSSIPANEVTVTQMTEDQPGPYGYEVLDMNVEFSGSLAGTENLGLSIISDGIVWSGVGFMGNATSNVQVGVTYPKHTITTLVQGVPLNVPLRTRTFDGERKTVIDSAGANKFSEIEAPSLWPTVPPGGKNFTLSMDGIRQGKFTLKIWSRSSWV